MSKIAFATFAEQPTLVPGDQLAADALEQRGFEVEAAVWDDSGIDWKQYAAVVIRSTWDYHLKAKAFKEWVSKLKHWRVKLLNPHDVILWNMNKTYLRDLVDNEIEVVPTVWLPGGAKADLQTLLAQKDWAQAVVKPTISASAYQTWLTNPQTAAQDNPRLREMLANSGVLVQQFMSAVQTHGEWSLMFFNKQFSHSVLKHPDDGDFRVGDHNETVDLPPAALVEQARAILDTIELPLAYTRVDGVEVDGKLVLMELELIEPYLFLEKHPAAPDRFAEAIAGML
ncbi:MAG: hypothetical protein JXB38_21155 [Anaerolineales bacterium]|nr:hypothetical protein [Anaerolineales bacterium]